MPRAVRYGNNDHRVDRRHNSTKRSTQLSDGEEVWIERKPGPGLEPMDFKPKRRSSRDVDPERVQQASLAAFNYLVNRGDFTPAEIGRVFGISRAGWY